MPFATGDKSEAMGISTPSPTIADTTTFEQAFGLLQKREESKLKEESSNRGTGTLVVWSTKENRGVAVYLLARNEWLNKTSAERDSSKQKKRTPCRELCKAER